MPVRGGTVKVSVHDGAGKMPVSVYSTLLCCVTVSKVC